MKAREFIAYSGSAFTIEWYHDVRGQSQALEYYNQLTPLERISLLKLLKKMGDFGTIKDKTKFRNEGDKLYAFKPQPDRFLCFFFKGRKIIITNAFRKKRQKLPEQEKERAMNYKQDYEQRIKGDAYYD